MERLNYIISLIIKYLDQSIGSSEKLYLDRWLDEHPDNIKFFNRIQKNWNSETEAGEIFDEERAIDLVMQRIKSGKRKPGLSMKERVHGFNTRFTRKLMIGWSRYAAVLAGIILISSLLLRNRESEIQFHTSHDQTKEITLSDGTVVMLNGSSTLKYTDNWDKKDLREVYLEGEAFFNVKPDTEKNFRVLTSLLEITAIGTSFNVKSYIDDDYIETTLVEGMVKITRTGEEGMVDIVQVTLEPNHKAVFLKKEEKMVVVEVDVAYPTAWTMGDLIFRNESLIEIINVLSRKFNVQIETKSERLDSFTVTVDFTDHPLDYNLNLLCKLIEAKYRFENHLIIIEEL